MINAENYLEIRGISKELCEEIFDWGKGKFDFGYAINKMGLSVDGKYIQSGEEEQDIIMDFVLYNSRVKGKRVLDLFYDSDIELGDLEENILEGMVNSEQSIFEITAIDADIQRCRLTLKDLLKNRSYEVINLGLSQTCEVGVILSARIIELEDGLGMLSGSTFAFGAEDKNRLLADYSFEKLRLRKNPTQEDLFLFSYKKSKFYGADLKHIDLNEEDEE